MLAAAVFVIAYFMMVKTSFEHIAHCECKGVNSSMPNAIYEWLTWCDGSGCLKANKIRCFFLDWNINATAGKIDCNFRSIWDLIKSNILFLTFFIRSFFHRQVVSKIFLLKTCKWFCIKVYLIKFFVARSHTPFSFEFFN